jgi:ABC-2 type transport system permease protein
MSAAAIVGTVVLALAFQGIAALPGLEGAKPYLLPQQFDAWDALFGQTGVSIGRAACTCALYTLVPLAAGWASFARRDAAGAPEPVPRGGRTRRMLVPSPPDRARVACMLT